MKTIKHILMTMLTTLIVVYVNAQQRNVLQVTDLNTRSGNVQLPVSIENTDEIVGAQFDLTLPDGITAEQAGTLGNRSDGHSVSISKLASGAYRVLLHSGQNRPLRGQSGVVMYLPINIPASLEEGSEHQLSITNAVLGIASGKNVLTETAIGKIHISKLPDLTVKSVNVSKTTLDPGRSITVSWQVENIGEIATGDGWSEQISLVNEDGTVTKTIATTYYEGKLEAGSVISRQADIMLPVLLGLDGQSQIQVQIIPNKDTGETASARGNNTMNSTEILNINKKLSLEITPKNIEENSTSRIAIRLNRSGSWTTAETFSLTATADKRITVPESITIPAGQSGTIIYLQLTDNNVLDKNSTIKITAQGNGYAAVSSKLQIIDNEYPDLSIQASKSAITEGESFTLTIATSRISSEDIEVTLSSENSKRFNFPANVVIPAGESSVSVEVEAVDDDLPSLILSNAFTASAANHNNAEAIVLLEDNDMPMLQLEITPATVSESAGVVSVAGVLRRTTNTDKKITVKLTDDADGGLYFGNRTLELAKGIKEAAFNFGPVDNAIVDGDRTYTITAAVWISSCSCGASEESAGSVQAQLKVLDNDGPGITLTSSLSTLKEGENTQLTVSRNTTDTSTPLIINLSSDYDENLTYQHSVTIPVGQQSATVEVTSLANSIKDDSHTVIFTAQTDGYNSGTCYIMVTDQTLPDAYIAEIVADKAEDEVGAGVRLTIEIANGGAAELPAETVIKIYRRGESSAVATVYTPDALGVGNTVTVTKRITLPATVGTNTYYAVVNETHSTAELSFNNNTSKEINVKTVAPFSVTIYTDKAVYAHGEKIQITGKLAGNKIAETDVELYLMNEGTRQTQRVTTDEEGNFNYTWELYSMQSGHFAVGACYPNEGLKTEMASFDVYGLRRTNSANITCDVVEGETLTGNIQLSNPGVLSLNNVKIELLSAPDNCEATLEIPAKIAGGFTAQIAYTLKGTYPTAENKWDEVKARISTAEGVSLDVTLYFYCRAEKAKLVANTGHITTTMTKGKIREYILEVTNQGKNNSGKITLALPDWITSLSGNPIAALPQNESATIILGLIPTDEMQLNVPVSGQIGINCENGDGTKVTFSVTPVSDENGVLIIDVTDEYTYNTQEKPHVEEAQVVVRNPVTDALVAQGMTGADGVYSVVLPEGYYKVNVTADNHDSYTNNIFVDPGAETRKTVNLSIRGIEVSYTVEPTEVEDVYDIVTTVKYETNVPVPVVVIDAPPKVDGDALAEGESLIFNVTLTNKGLIKADNVTLYLPEVEGWTIEKLSDFKAMTLLPQQSVIIPIKLTKSIMSNYTLSKANILVSQNSSSFDFRACVESMILHYEWLCGHSIKNNEAAFRMILKACTAGAFGDAISNMFSGLNTGSWNMPSQPGTPGTPNKDSKTEYEKEERKEIIETGTRNKGICDPEYAEKCETVIDCLAGTYGGGVGQAYKFINLGMRLSGNGDNLDKTKALLSTFAPYNNRYNEILDKASDIFDLGDALEDLINYEQRNKAKSGNHANSQKMNTIQTGVSWFDSYCDTARPFYEELAIACKLKELIYGDLVWFNQETDEIQAIVDYVNNFDNEVELKTTDMLELKPSGVTYEQFDKFIQRINNTITGSATDNCIDIEIANRGCIKIIEYEENAKKQGYDSMYDLYYEASEKFMKDYEEASKSVCASITLQFNQTMKLTRQAFRGTLTVFNGHENTAMTNVKLKLNVTDENGKEASPHEFQINAESLEGFYGELDLTSGWTLNANNTGIATVLYTPTKYAAPTEPVNWSFGGTLSYVDPFTGLEVTRELYPVTLTVNPSPVLDLAYFMQRDVYGDDPLTTDVVEPRIPAEFALIINNKGYGDATNVEMITQQPEIIENEKGLLINFENVSSQLNGADANLSFGKTIANDFGNIAAHSQAYAQWWMTSSLLGHFTEYNVEATHVTSYGNKDLTLLDDVSIHELIHGFTVRKDGEKTVRGFLVNEIEDAEDTPDSIFFTDATQQSVYVTENAAINKISETEYELVVNVNKAGWNYGTVFDPTYGRQKLVKVVRADGTEINVDNFWQTDRTLRDGKDWLYENRLHWIGNMSQEGETFTITFEPKPDLLLEVESFAGVPEKGTVQKEQVTEITVKFNKPINAESFTTEDITINCQGIAQDASLIVIEQVNESEFNLKLKEVTLRDGYYVLNVQTAGIKDKEGYYGEVGKPATWIQFVDGKVPVSITASPTEGGTVTPGSNRFDYDSDVILNAVASEGYEFVGWTGNGETISSDSEYTHHVTDEADLKALFAKKRYKISVDYESSYGVVDGAATGIYDYGTQLQFSAVPTDGYKFDAWLIDEKRNEGNSAYSLVVDRNVNITALFEKIMKKLSVTTNIVGWASFTPEFNSQIAEGATAYIITQVNHTEQKAMAIPIETMERGTGYFVKGEAGTEYSVTETEAIPTSTEGNMLVGCLRSVVLNSAEESGTMYFLGTKNGTSGLYYVDGIITIPAGKAYLQVDSNILDSAKMLIIETTPYTDISNVKSPVLSGNSVRKYIKNKMLIIERGDGEYSIVGIKKK